MNTNADEIADLKAKIIAYEAMFLKATSEERQDRLLETITAARNQLTEMMRAAAERDLTSFMSPLTPF